MNTTKQIRLAKFKKLAKEYRFIKDFCSKIGIHPTYYTQIINNDKSIGDKIARRIEDKLKLPVGYMDNESGVSHKQNNGEIIKMIDNLPTDLADNIKKLIASISA